MATLFAMKLPLPHLVHRKRFTKATIGAFAAMPNSFRSASLKKRLRRHCRHRTWARQVRPASSRLALDDLALEHPHRDRDFLAGN